MSDLIERLEKIIGDQWLDDRLQWDQAKTIQEAIDALSPALPEDVTVEIVQLYADSNPRYHVAADLLERQAREIKTWQNQDLLEQCNKQADRIEQLEAALNVAINGLGEIARGYDYSGHQIDRALYAAGLSDQVSKLWEAALAERNDDAT